MHGVVFFELQKFTENDYGQQAWRTVLSRAGLTGRVYAPTEAYPDAEIQNLVNEISTLTRRPVMEVLESFGEFIVPALLSMFGHLLQPDWRALEVIEHTEGTIHTVVRAKHPGAAPPHLRTRRVSPDEVIVVYTSPRRMCSLAIGIGRGLGRHFRENLFIRQTQCMHQGAPLCEIVFQTAKAAVRSETPVTTSSSAA